MSSLLFEFATSAVTRGALRVMRPCIACFSQLHARIRNLSYDCHRNPFHVHAFTGHRAAGVRSLAFLHRIWSYCLTLRGGIVRTYNTLVIGKDSRPNKRVVLLPKIHETVGDYFCEVLEGTVWRDILYRVPRIHGRRERQCLTVSYIDICDTVNNRSTT